MSKITIKTLEEFNNLEQKIKDELTIRLNLLYKLYSINYEIPIYNGVIRGKGYHLVDKEYSDLMSLEQLDKFYNSIITKNNNRFNYDEIYITNCFQLYVTAYSFFKIVSDPQLIFDV